MQFNFRSSSGLALPTFAVGLLALVAACGPKGDADLCGSAPNNLNSVEVYDLENSELGSTGNYNCCPGVEGDENTQTGVWVPSSIPCATFDLCNDQAIDTRTATCCNIAGVSVAIPEPDANCADFNLCGEATFDPTEQSCCPIDSVPTLVSGAICANVALCGDVQINLAEQTCCNRQVFPFPDLDCSDHFTCGPDLDYFPSLQTCCEVAGGNVVLSGVDASCENAALCGGVQIDLAEQTCCNRQIFPFPDLDCSDHFTCGPDLDYFPSLQTCCEVDGVNVVLSGANASCENVARCGDVGINLAEQTCCNRDIYPFPNLDCFDNFTCGEFDYAPTVQTCCRLNGVETVVPGGDVCRNAVLCGSVGINLAEETCCWGDVFPFPNVDCLENLTCGDFDYAPSLQTCCRNPNATAQTQVVDELNADCAEFNRLCGTTPLPDGQECCALGNRSFVPFDPATQSCCPNAGRIHEAPGISCDCVGPEGTSCCGGATAPLDGSLECCPSSYTPAVGPGSLYDPSTDSCCRAGNIQTLGSATCDPIAFCGVPSASTSYNPNNSVCCNEELGAISAIGTGCDECGGVPFSAPYACCDGMLIETLYTECCEIDGSFEVVNAGTCESEPLRICGGDAISAQMQCCGAGSTGVSFDPGISQCCPGDVIAPAGQPCPSPQLCGGFPYSGVLECCGDARTGTSFNPVTQQCCDPTRGTILNLGEVCVTEYCGGLAVSEDQDCCGNAVSGTLFIPTEQQCCLDDTLISITDECPTVSRVCGGFDLEWWAACCGNPTSGTAYNPETQICCDPDERIVVTLPDLCPTATCGGTAVPVGQSCCGNATTGTSFDPAAQQCCDPLTGVVAPAGSQCPTIRQCGGSRLAADRECCGTATVGTAYDPDTQYCCDPLTSVVVADASLCPVAEQCGGSTLATDRDCCGNATTGTSYNPTTQQCCDAATGRIAGVSESCTPAEICGGFALDDDLDCCGDAFFGSGYDPATEQCCNSFTGDIRLIGQTCVDIFFGIWGPASECGGDIFFSDFSNGLMRADGDTLEVSLFAPGSFVYGNLCDGDAMIYTDVTSGIYRKPLDGGDATRIIGDETTQAATLAMSGNYIFWARDATSTNIWRYDRTTEETIQLVTNQFYVKDLLSDGTWLYWIEKSGFTASARRILIDGTMPSPEVLTTDFQSLDNFYELVIANGMLWTASPETNRVLGIPTAGGSSPTFVSTSESRPFAIAADDTYLYWRNETAGDIIRWPFDASAAPAIALDVPDGGSRGDVILTDDWIYAVDAITHQVYRGPR